MKTATITLAMALLSIASATAAAESKTPQDGSTKVPAVIFEPGPYYADEARMFQGIPGLERAPGGRLWVTWYGGGVTEDHFNYIMLVTSGDNGHTWSGLKTVIDPDVDGPCRAFDPCPWLDPDGQWLLPVALWKEKGSATAVSSKDRGKTRETIGRANIPNEKDRNCDEHMIVERADGAPAELQIERQRIAVNRSNTS